MADPAQFDHDRIGHLLSDRLLTVPRFQRRYSWTLENVDEYWSDVENARASGNAYFLGTIVLASDVSGGGRKLIVDGQQRITTTALLIIAIRDRLQELGKTLPAQSVQDTYLSDYVLSEESTVAKLSLSSSDHSDYTALLGNVADLKQSSPITQAYLQLKSGVDLLAPDADSYRNLIELVEYLNNEVQVLLAVASSLAEAYVIFETLNDRGADLTTADLLKNYLFSNARETGIAHAEQIWTELSAKFDKPEDFVKFLRYEHMSRKGRVTNRALYRSLQDDIGSGPKAVRTYLERLKKRAAQYTALREPDDISWSAQAVEVRDSLLAFRRFGFEASMPLLLAAFATWKHSDATRFTDVVASWSVRAWMAGTLGGGVAERAFCNAAVAVTSGEAKSVDDIRPFMKDLVPDDAAFRESFLGYGPMTTTRAKYLLARIERQQILEDGDIADAMPDWSSKSVSVEHIFAKSSKREQFESDDEYERFHVLRDRLQNYTLLERTLNGNLDDKAFVDKAPTYARSAFRMTQELGSRDGWNFEDASDRAEQLADRAVKAWPM